jgi:hypothetical protein
MTDPHDIRLEATCGTARVELRLTPSGFSVDEHLHTQPHVGEAVSPCCDDARDQAEMLVALWGADGVAAAASGESRDVGHVAYRLAEPLRVGYSITTDGGVREESIRQLSEGQWVHVAVRNDIATAGTAVVNGPYASVAAALEANVSALRSNGTEATITCDDKYEVLLLDLLGGAEFEELVVNDVPWIESEPGWLPDQYDDPGNLHDRLDVVEQWDNDNDYSFPGGDRSTELARWGDHYFAHDDWGGWDYLGRYADQDEAVRTWAERYIPDGMAGLEAYQRSADDDDDEDDDDDDEDDLG